MKKALFYRKLNNLIVQCQLCPNFCTLKEGECGKCNVRKNNKGKLYSLSYGSPVSINIDPIIKKPLYHFLQDTFTFSIGMAGCNLSCPWCQNNEISQKSPEEFNVKYISSKELVAIALKSRCPSISYTYTEPFVSYEYVYDCARLAKKAKLKNILVTNGFVNEKPFEKISKYIDAMNIDLKTFNDKTYQDYCNARLTPILKIIKKAYKKKIHIEITTLIIPDVNDSEKELKKIAGFIAKMDKNIPWHISRFFPHFKMQNKEATDLNILKKACEIGKKAGLRYVHPGNI